MRKRLLNNLSRFSGLLLILILSMSAATAQNGGGIKGKVRNLRGDKIADATVTARQNSNDIRSVKTNSKGEFVLEGLAPGTYNFVFDAMGYSSAIKNNVEIKANKIVDMGDRLFMQIDRGTQVIVNGSVFFKDGTSVTAAKVDVEKIAADGTSRKVGTYMTSISGEFAFRQPDGPAKFRITARYKDSTATKDFEVGSAAVYRVALSLSINRQDR